MFRQKWSSVYNTHRVRYGGNFCASRRGAQSQAAYLPARSFRTSRYIFITIRVVNDSQGLPPRPAPVRHR